MLYFHVYQTVQGGGIIGFGRIPPEVLRAYIAAGSIAAAAYKLGISKTTTRQHPLRLYRRTGCLNVAQAAYLLGTRQLDSDATTDVDGPTRGATRRPRRPRG